MPRFLADTRAAGALIAAGVFALDQATKHWAISVLGAHSGHLPLPGPVDLSLVFNRSNAFGIVPIAGDFTRWGLAAFNLLVGSILLLVLSRRPSSHWVAAGVGFIAAAAFGNAADRFVYGAVVDFIDASKIGFGWVFNIADASVDIGIACLALAVLRDRGKTPSAVSPGDTD